MFLIDVVCQFLGAKSVSREFIQKIASCKAAEYVVFISAVSCIAFEWYQFACQWVSHGFDFADPKQIVDSIEIDPPPVFLSGNKEELIMFRGIQSHTRAQNHKARTRCPSTLNS